MLASDEFKILGSNLFVIPLGLSLAAWMWIGNARRMALSWAALFTAGLAVVAASKMAFIGWGFEIDAIDFQGVSGHAMRATAVFPVILYLILYDTRRAVRLAGIYCGLLFGALMAVSVSVHDTHSASESIAGFVLGAAVSLGFIRTSARMRKPVLDGSRIALISFSSAVLISGTLNLKTDPTYRWLEDATRYLSGNDKPFSR